MDTKHLILLCLLSAGIVLGCETKQETTEASDLAPVEATPPNRVHRAYEAISLLGDTLYSDEMLTTQSASEDSAAHAAEQAYANAPTLPNTLALGQSLAHRSQFQEAIRVFTQGLAAFPDSPELYRYRGQQYITVRQFDKAVQDLEKSAQLLKNRPVSAKPEEISPSSPTKRPAALPFEVSYYLGLAYYLQGQYGAAAQSYEQSLPYAQTDDDRVAAADWLYMTYRRLGEDEVAEKTLAAIDEEMPIQYPEGYFEQLMMYKGLVDPDSLLGQDASTSTADRELMIATYGYGVSHFYQAKGDSVLSQQIKEKIVSGKYWAAFGYIAAEADLARERKQE